jgi:hypothetical protein
VATCFRSNTVSLVDVEQALAGAPAEDRRVAFPLRTAVPGVRAGWLLDVLPAAPG